MACLKTLHRSSLPSSPSLLLLLLLLLLFKNKMDKETITTIPVSQLEEGRAPSISSSEDTDLSLATPRGSLSTLHNEDWSPRLSTQVEDITRVNTPAFDSSTNPNKSLEKPSHSAHKQASSEISEKDHQPIPKLELEEDESPLNWSKTKKWGHTILAALIFFNASFGSSSANSASQIYQEVFGVKHVVATLVLSIFILG